MVMVRCTRCGYVWNYRGRLKTKSGRTRLPERISCPNCHYPQLSSEAKAEYKAKGYKLMNKCR